MDIRWLMELMLQLYINFTRETDIGSVFFLVTGRFQNIYLNNQRISETLMILY